MVWRSAKERQRFHQAMKVRVCGVSQGAKGHGLWGKKEHSTKSHTPSLDDLTLSAYNRPLNGAVHA
jgi:hypothetical protein